jgi:hypothetical protein
MARMTRLTRADWIFAGAVLAIYAVGLVLAIALGAA